MKDFLNQNLNVGDSVVFIQPYYHNFQKGEILSLTPKKAWIKWKKWERTEESCIFQSDIIKYSKEVTENVNQT